MKKIFSILLISLISINILAGLPTKTNRLVNDFANILTTEQVSTLEQNLEAFSDSTSNQICIVTTDDLCGYEIGDYAQRLGHEWGVGNKKYDNGVMIVIKPRRGTIGGKVFIATGYGVEGVLPDALCKRIIERDMIPFLKEGDYFKAIDASLTTIIPTLNGEYHNDIEEIKFTDLTTAEKIIICFVIAIFILLVMGFIMSIDDGFSSGGGFGSSSFSGIGTGGSSFGGFGGGSFGGGGAGGSF